VYEIGKINGSENPRDESGGGQSAIVTSQGGVVD